MFNQTLICQETVGKTQYEFLQYISFKFFLYPVIGAVILAIIFLFIVAFSTGSWELENFWIILVISYLILSLALVFILLAPVIQLAISWVIPLIT